MTFDEFVNTYRGQRGLGTNPSDKGECLGLLNFGEQQMRGLTYPIQGVTYARDFLNGNNTRPDIYERVVNDPNSATQVPSKGDMIVWANVGDPRGHVGYVWDAPQGVNSLQVFDAWQGAPAQIRSYSYNTCQGWWHIKTKAPEPPVAANQRKVGSAGVKYRKEPNTGSDLLITDVITDGIVDGGQIANLQGFVHGQSVDGNDVWFKGIGGGYMWSGAFEDTSTNGLSNLDLTPPPQPETPPTEPPYSFVPDLACVTEVIPAANGNFQHGNFPDKPEKAVIHDFGTAGKDTYTGTIAWFKNPASETSAHFVISGKRITQMVSLKDRAYHAGSKGNGFVGIETDPAQDIDTINSTRTVLKQLKDKYGYQLALIKHSELMATSCGDDVDLAKYDITEPVTPPVEPEKPVDPPVTPPEPEKPVTPPTDAPQTLWDVVKGWIAKLIDWLSQWTRSK